MEIRTSMLKCLNSLQNSWSCTKYPLCSVKCVHPHLVIQEPYAQKLLLMNYNWVRETDRDNWLNRKFSFTLSA